MAMDDKCASLPKGRSGRGLGRFFKGSLLRILGKLVGRFVGASRIHPLYSSLGGFLFCVERSCVGVHGFPGISGFTDALGNGMQIEYFWTFQSVQFLPLQWR